MKLCFGCMKEIEDDEHICPFCGYKEDQPVSAAYYLTPGVRLNHRYLVGKVLGCGGFGVTYIGKDIILNRTVAVKEYFPGDFATRRFGSRAIEMYSGEAQEGFLAGLNSFISEARRLAQINDINGIVHVYDYFQENNTGYIVMEYLQGRTIKEILETKKRFSFDEAEKIIIPVLEALSEVHKAGLIHRDIAPDNIFITRENVVKVLDFGAARYAVTNVSKSLSVIVKSGYSPAEQYRVNGQQGPWTDIYGVGATFYRMIVGFHPQEALERIIEDKIILPSDAEVKISPGQEKVLMKSLSVKGKDRYQSADEFLNALKDAKPKPESTPKTGFAIPAKLLIVAAGIGVGILIGVIIGSQISSGGKVQNSTTEINDKTEALTDTDNESETKAESIVLNLSVNGELHTVEVENLTEMEIQEINITGLWKDEKIYFDKKSILSGEPLSAEIEDGRLYQIEVSNPDTGDKMCFYNLNLSSMENLRLNNWDGYTYAVYKDSETGQEVSQIQYRAMTWEKMKTRYSLVRLNVRSLPDEQNGQVLEQYSIGTEITVYGQAVGLSAGKESFWYLVRSGSQIGYISAEAKYTSSEKSPALTVTPVLQQSSVSAGNNNNTGVSSSASKTTSPTAASGDNTGTGTDSETETETDSGSENETDTGTNSNEEAGTEDSTEITSEGGTDTGTYTGNETGTDTDSDSGSETISDTGSSTGSESSGSETDAAGSITEAEQ